MSQTVAQGRRGGVVAGLAAGSIIQVVAAALGLSAVFVMAPRAYTALKLAEAAYLIWLGVQLLRASGGTARPGAAPPAAPDGRHARTTIALQICGAID